MPTKFALLALAGAMGTLARYGTGLLVERHVTGIFPWPTLVVNMIGCFVFGVFYAFAETRTGWTGDVRLIVLTGFMGAFTTFSTFAYNSGALLRESEWALAGLNLFVQNGLGIALLLLGIAVGKLF